MVNSQNNGDYSEALEYYKRVYYLKKIKLIEERLLKIWQLYMSNGEEDLSIETYEKALKKILNNHHV